jgi:hypothetical protein
MDRLRAKSELLTAFLEVLIDRVCGSRYHILARETHRCDKQICDHHSSHSFAARLSALMYVTFFFANLLIGRQCFSRIQSALFLSTLSMLAWSAICVSRTSFALPQCRFTPHF